jgi:peptidoglycan/xylan/chitin deacetylase (PgdA/CDA1 family)
LIYLNAQVQGIGRSYVIDTFAHFIEFLNNTRAVTLSEDRDENGVNETYTVYVKDLKSGDNILIAEKDVPDFWIEKNSAVSDLGSYDYNGTTYSLGVTVGGSKWGRAHILETDYTVIEGHATSAAASASDAKKSETNAKTSETNAKTSETNASASATSAGESATEAQTARDEAQAIADGIGIVQETGNSPTAVMSQKAVTDEIVGTTKEDSNTSDLWEVGSISAGNGNNGGSEYRLRTKRFLSPAITKIYADYPYDFCIFAYDTNGAYVGIWNGSAFGLNETYFTEFDFYTLYDAGYNYKYKIKARHQASIVLTGAEYVNFHLVNDIYRKIEDARKEAEQANAVAVSLCSADLNNTALWEKGGINDAGAHFSSTDRLRTRSYVNKETKHIYTDAGYSFYVMCYNENGTLAGMWNGTEIVTSCPAMNVLDVSAVDGYKLRLMLRRKDDTALSVDESANIHFLNDIYTRLNQREDVSVVADAPGDVNKAEMWEKGGISANGNYGAANVMRTKDYIPENVKLIYSEKDYSFYVAVYNEDGEFVGFWNREQITETANRALYYFRTDGLPDYKFRIMLQRFDITSMDLTEFNNVHFLDDIYARSFSPIPTLTFIDDDGSKEALENWESIADEVGVKITACLVTGGMSDGVTNTTRASWTDVARLQNKGFEFVSHTHNHIDITSNTEEVVVSEFENSIAALREHGCESRYLVYPYNAITPDLIPLVRKYFSAGVGLGGETDNTLPIYTYWMRRYSINNEYEFVEKEYNGETVSVQTFKSLETLKGYIDITAANGSWAIIMTHLRNDDKFYHDEDSRRMIIDLCKYAIQKGLRIQTFGEAFPRFKNQMEQGTIFDASHYIVDCNGVEHYRGQ